MSRAVYTPINEIPGSTLGGALPEYSVPEHVNFGDRIGVDLQRLGHIARWGGFEADVRLHAYQGDVTKTNISIAGAAGKDTAVAGRSVTATARMGQGQYEPGTASTRQRLPLSLLVNTAEIAQRVEDRRQPARDPNSWAPHLDRSLRQGLRQAAWRHLVSEKAPSAEVKLMQFELAIAALMLGMEVVTDNLGAKPSLFVVGEALLFVETTNALKLAHRIRGRSQYADPVYSAVPIWYLDRAAVVAARTLSPRPLVKAL